MSTKIVHTMTAAQCRAARALLDMTQSALAAAAGLGLSTVVDFEKGRRDVSKEGIAGMQRALEGAGLAFARRGVAIVSRVKRGELREPEGPFRELSHLDIPITKTGSLSSTQIRAARALLRWSVADLAQASALGVNTIRRAEVAEEGTSLTAANDLAIRRALESAGVVFIDENGGGPGVRLRESRRGRKSKA
jgi:transcriptional regulator with XRE-family HTH domain